MSKPLYPNESTEYRDARDALLREEQALIDQVRRLAERRRHLPPGGKVPEDYEFEWATDDRLGQKVKLSELFGDKDTLVIYSFMYGPGWDNPCLSCTSIVDGLDRTAYQVSHHAAFFALAKARAEQINAWAKKRNWSQINLISGYGNSFQADYRCQGESDDLQQPVMLVFQRVDGEIRHFYSTELPSNGIDMVWTYWNVLDMTPEGRPDRLLPPQNFRSRFLEEHYLNAE